jgi:hypothetical protein
MALVCFRLRVEGVSRSARTAAHTAEMRCASVFFGSIFSACSPAVIASG